MSIKIYTGLCSVLTIPEVLPELEAYRESIIPNIEVGFRDIPLSVRNEPESIIQLMPYPNADGTLAIVLPQTSLCHAKGMGTENLIADIITKTSFFDYSYWNNSDRPEGMCEDEWEGREERWAAVMPGWKAIKNYGVTFFLSDFYSLRKKV